MIRSGCLTAIALTLVTLVGCGPVRTSVNGQIVLNGKAIKGTDDAPLQVTLCPILDEKDSFSDLVTAEVNQTDGTFVANKVIAGKVRVAVTQVDRNSLKDRFDDKFGEGGSPIIRDTSTSQELKIDLARPTN